MSTGSGSFIRSIKDVTTGLLSEVLGIEVASFKTQRIGTGLVGECHRIHLQYASDTQKPASVVIKIAATDPDSRQTGKSLKLYDRESRFYSELAPALNLPSLVRCHHTSFSEKEDSFYLLLEDVRPATIGNELVGATIEQARIALMGLGHFQAASMKLEPPPWLLDVIPPSQIFMQQMWALFLQRYADRVKPEQRRIMERWLACFDGYVEENLAPAMVKCLVHGDYRLDNMLFRDDDSVNPLAAVDFQTVGWGSIFRDVAYFMGCALRPEDRRAHADQLLRAYFEALGPDPPFTFDECREGVRRQTFAGLGLAFVSPMILERTSRGDEMFLVMFDRLLTQIVDLDAVDTLPPAAIPEPIKVNPDDETAHPPGEELLYNESWYFDMVDPKQGIGLWIRLGVTPHQPGSWYTALICGPNRPTIAAVDLNVKHPGPDLTVTTAEFSATQTVVSPLKEYRVTLSGQASSHANPASLTQPNATGTPVQIELDLTWHTTGQPYQWQMATRYEIPCTVSGTLTVDRETTRFTHALGQRDHSWGERDWWGSDWVWTAFHLSDGTHLHGVEVRPPGRPRFGVGYTQRVPRDGGGEVAIAELTAVAATEVMDPADHLVGQGTVRYSARDAEDVVLQVTSVGHAPLRLECPDGRGGVAWFPRAWARVATEDGRSGWGWIEWNVNERPAGVDGGEEV